MERQLAFIDTETTGLDAATDRVIEIGVVAVTNGAAEEWTTLLNPRTPRASSSRLLQEIGEERARALPRFRDVAAALLQRVENRLLVAHNARFDYAFLKSEFARAGVRFEAEVVCSLSLSRKLYRHQDRHDLASLVERHGLSSDVRHRALPDARALYELWQQFHRDYRDEQVAAVVRDLLASPLLPPGLNPALIERLPEKPGVYVLHGKERALHVGRASNLRLKLANFFRIDRISRRSTAWVDSIVDITWQVASGDLGARLQEVAVARAAFPDRHHHGDAWSWRFDPQGRPALALSRLPENACTSDASFGIFRSERRARNALSRLAAQYGLCRTLLDLPAQEAEPCPACRPGSHTGKRQNLEHLAHACAALLPWKIAPWPYPGPIAVREGRDLHVADLWRYLGTVRGINEVHAILEERPPPFDAEIYALLGRALPRLSRRRVAQLQRARARAPRAQ